MSNYENKSRVRIEMRVTKEEKEFIKNKSNELGYNSMTAFLLESSKTYFRLKLDMSVYRKLTKEINYIGKNINGLIRRINSNGFYSDGDIDIIKMNQKKIYTLINKEYKRLNKMEDNVTSESLTLKQKENLIESLKDHKIETPKKVVLEEIYDQIKDDVLYIGEAIELSPQQEDVVSDYLWEYLYGRTIFELPDKELIEFADKIFMFAEKMKMKFLKLDNIFEDEDWYELKEILDDYEVD